MKKLFWTLYFILGSLMQVECENGYDLWLRYLPLPDSLVQQYSRIISPVKILGDSPAIKAASGELQLAFSGLLAENKPVFIQTGSASLLIGSVLNKEIRKLLSENEINHCKKEGFILKTISGKKGKITVISGKTDAGVLYGAFTLIRMMQTGEHLDNLNIHENPGYDLRLLNHWDNLNGTVDEDIPAVPYGGNGKIYPDMSTSKPGIMHVPMHPSGSTAVLNNVNASVRH